MKTKIPSMYHSFGAAACAGAVLLLAATMNAQAQYTYTTLTLFGTGVDSGGNALSGGSSDPHYYDTTLNAPGVVLSSLWFQWLPDDAHSAWIGWVDNPFPGNYGEYFNFEITFDLTGYDPSTASLVGTWAADQWGTISLNGQTVASVSDGNWNVANDPNLNAFSITSGFVSGVNRLDFSVDFYDGYDGLRVEPMTLTVAPVPEPSALGLLAAGAAAFLLRRRWHP
jgi:hypothetical protein